MIDSISLERSPLQQDQAVALLAVAADPVRWRLLAELARGGTRCVCDLRPVGGVAPNVLSYHLKVLREAGLVTSARRGRWVDYTLADDAPARISAALPTHGAGTRLEGHGPDMNLYRAPEGPPPSRTHTPGA